MRTGQFDKMHNDSESALLQDILMEIASNFINVPLEHTGRIINSSLETLGQFTDADRAYVFVYDHVHRSCSNTYEWCREGIDPQIEELQHVPYDVIPDWIGIHFSGQTMVIDDVLQLDPESAVRQILEPQGIKSLITIPMMDADICTGFVGFDSVRNHHRYSEKEQRLLQLFALMLVHLHNRNQIQIQLNEAMLKAEAASKAKSEFLANMSHEIRTPLNGVIGFTDLLKHTPLNSTQQQYVDYANASGHTLLSIINEILDFSKIESGMMDFEHIRSDIYELIDQSVELVRLNAASKGIQLILNIDKHLPRYAWTDPVRLKQIFTNLLNNAVKFTEKGEIEMQARYEPLTENQGRFYFSVRDTGIGITDEQKKHLFKAFSQGDNSITRKFGGTGLGLVISEMIAQKLGSTIQIDNSSPEGTTFYFELLATAQHEDGVSDVVRPSVPATSENLFPTLANATVHQQAFSPVARKILLVEDVMMNRLMVRAQLEILIPGENYLEAENGLQAVEMYAKYLPDLIIMDIHMPEMDGIQATIQIREQEKQTGRHVPIIALTADAFTKKESNCLQSGMDYFLTKPLNSDKLRALIQDIFSPTEKDSIIHFDSEQTLLRCGNKKELVLKLISIVLTDLPIQLEKLDIAFKEEHVEEIWKVAHKIKGTSLNLGFPLLKEKAAILEQAGRSSEQVTPQLQSLINDLKKEWEILLPMLKNY